MKLLEFDYYIWAIKNEATLYGFFSMITTKRRMREEDLQIINMAAKLSALKLGTSSNVSGKGNYSEILADLLTGAIKTEYELSFRMLTRHWIPSDRYQVFLIDLQGKSEKYIKYVKKGIEAISHRIKHITFEEFEFIMLDTHVLNSSDGTKLNDYVMQYNLISGVSDPFTSLLNIKHHYEQAKKAILFGSQDHTISYYSDYRFNDFLNNCAITIECNKYYHPLTR